MPTVPRNDDEILRLSAVHDLEVLDSEPEPEFDALARAAAIVCNTPLALITLVDADRIWFKAAAGRVEAMEAPRRAALCSQTILSEALFEIADARLDSRFADHPFVAGASDPCFYAGAPITLAGGQRVGTVCVIDRVPRQLDANQREVLRCLAETAARALEARRALRAQRAAALELAAREASCESQRQIESALLEDRQRLANIIEGTQIGTWEWNVQTGAQRINDHWARQLGYTVAELEPVSIETWRRHTHPEDLARVNGLLARHFAHELERFECEIRMRHRDGHWVWVLDRGRVMSWTADGAPEWMFGTHQDVTERVSQRMALEAANERVSLAADGGRIGIWDWNLVTGQRIWDAWIYRLYGISPDQDPASYALWCSLLHPEDAAAVQRAVQAAIDGTAPLEIDFRVIWPDGSIHYLRSMARVSRDATGCPVRMVGADWDVTEPRRLAAELAEQHELLRVTLESIGDAVITTDARGWVVWLNPEAERLTGWQREAARGRPLAHVFQVVHEETRRPAQNPVAVCLGDEKPSALAGQTLLISRSGEEFGIEDSVAPIRSARGELLGTVLVFHDVSEQRRLAGEMTWRATHDALTGLINRPEFETRLRRLLVRAPQDASEHALLYIDLDQFKLINDACGHAVGDQALLQAAKLLAKAVRSSDTLARLGGDEFAILLEGCSAERAHQVAQQICASMDEFRFLHEARRFRIGASIGLVALNQRWTSPAAIMQAADSSCYAAKDAGRNRVHIWFDSDQAMRLRQGETQWATRIEQAFDEQRFALFAQRILPLRGDTAGVHAEVLLRMIGDAGEVLLPGTFLPAAERFHLASRIDRWVLRSVIGRMQAAASVAQLESLSVNLSGQSIGDRSFHRWATELLAEAGPALCRKLCLEITETATVTNLADAVLFIEQVRAAGVKVALDDFGAGVSSFGYLKSLPIDYLKIDGQFIRDLVEDPLDEAAVRCFVDVAATVGVRTVAEFVDHPAVLDRVCLLGIDFAQGFLVHRPAPIEELLDLGVAAVR